MSSSWLKVSCVALGAVLAMSAIPAVAASSTHASTPIIVQPILRQTAGTPIIVQPILRQTAGTPIIVQPILRQTAGTPIIVQPILRMSVTV